ncbi:hypothetical protein COY90_05600 [Candidatus Roizmanbacteria bacterium CG_4_10_14_0_8_um_filter_39_9]|uniref:Peptidase M20 dimerisation domain-containing protein n=1 Tax=Candidatus Roizmanbacteria bacterium CG_4_10_14_0_8_um_filter_39_9 TaxID=1974829 RepID=A0A2M7QBA8_9BACT|nr:MAG: hypothetical protein COY90_05600 [Candidatus Roizmanbacteria bacterium CG_4_10_14_0_8_um_filter_39_9]
MIDQILSLSKKLISIPSTKDNPQGLSDVLDIAKNELTGFTIEEFESRGIKSILVYKGDVGQRKFKFILDAHLDVVPGREDQYRALQKNGKLYARGAIDMKAAAAVELLVFKEMANSVSYPLALQLVTDEEIGGFDGAKFQADQGVRAEFAIAGEGTDLKIKNEAKGVLWATISTKGKTAHAAYLWQGINAIREMNKVVTILSKAFPQPNKPVWKSTMNIAQISSSNKTFNKVPDDCSVGIDVRYIPDDTDSIVKKIENLLPAGVTLDIQVKEPAQFTDKNNKYIKFMQKTVKKIVHKSAPTILGYGASDIRHFNRVGNDGIEFGPIGYGLHTDDEWVDIKSLQSYYDILKEFLMA